MIWPEKFTLKNKLCVVTGGLGLIGRCIAQALAEAGGFIIIVDNKDDNDYMKQLVVSNLNIKLVYANIADINIAKNLAKEINDQYGEINVWVNSAYPRTPDYGSLSGELNEKSWNENLYMQLSSCYWISRGAAELMKKYHSGSIINIGSIYGLVAPDFRIYENTDMTMPGVYSAVKGGIIAFSRYLASSYAKYNVRVNVVCPGGVYNSQPEQFIKNYSKKCLLGRLARPEEIAGPVLFLSSEASSYMTGTVMMVDGGWTAI